MVHTIAIKQNDASKFDVLINGFSYRVHRNLDSETAADRACEIKAEFLAMKQRAVIER